MRWRTALEWFVEAVDAEFERRILAASDLQRYRTSDERASAGDEISFEIDIVDEEINLMFTRIKARLYPFKYVIILFVTYCVLFVVTYAALSGHLSEPGEAFRIAYSIGTDGDPANAYVKVKDAPLLWGWMLIFHVLSWLALPLVAAAAVDVVLRLAEERKRKAEERMQSRLSQIATLLGRQPEEIKELLEKLYETERHSQ
jgi:hypothetical protein